MYKNSYISLTDFKNRTGVTTTTDDDAMLDTLEGAARTIDNYCGRHFWCESATKYFDGALVLWIPDLLSITASGLQTDEDGDRTYENTFSSGDYIEYGAGDAINTFPINRLEISESSSYGSFAMGVKQGVKVAGTWGYGDGTSAPYITDTTLAVSCSTEATASVTSAANLSAGMTILWDSEQAYIESVSGTKLTLTRGVNGTTAADHAAGTQIYYYVYPWDISQACADLTSAIWDNRTRKGIQSERLGDYSYTIAGTSMNKGMTNSILDDSIKSYRKMRV